MNPLLIRLIFAVALMVGSAWVRAEGNSKLYLKDGTYHIVREFNVEGDRVRFYSTERSQWEEIPADLVDLKKTEAEIKQRQEAFGADAKILEEEDKAEREAQLEIERIPKETGVYLVTGQTIKPLKPAESKVVTDKGRSVLKVLSPIPMISGRARVEVAGLHSANVANGPRPEFYIRLSEEERFGIVRMGEHKDSRVAEKLTIVPVTKEIVEEPDMVEIFRKQVGENVYKIWPEKPLPPGEYAVVEYTEGKANMQIWDFAMK